MSRLKKNIHIICPSNKLGGGEDLLLLHYRNLIEKHCDFKLDLIKPLKGANKIQSEGKEILTRVPKSSCVICLSERGQHYDTAALAQTLENKTKWCVIVGSSDGLDQSVIEQSHVHLALSKMTLTHQLALCVITEQLYRIISIYNQHPYHRA